MKDSWLPGVRMPCQLCRACASLRRPASSARRGCSPFRWTAWTVKTWGRHWENRGLPSVLGSTARRWRTAPQGRWMSGPYGSVFPPLTPAEMWTRWPELWRGCPDANKSIPPKRIVCASARGSSPRALALFFSGFFYEIKGKLIGGVLAICKRIQYNI